MFTLFWILFIVLITTILLGDLFLEKRRASDMMTFGQSLTETLSRIVIALLFNVAIYWIYEWQLLYPPGTLDIPQSGKEAALLFFTGYIIEKSLSVDNIFVIALIFSYFSIPAKFQHRVLLWGIFGAVVLRLIMIILGTALIRQFAWMDYVFGFLLLATAIKMLTVKLEEIHPERNPMVRLAKKLFPVTHDIHGNAFFVSIEGVRHATPLFLALIVIETSDLLFAIDSIPAIFAITHDPFIVYTSNIFALLGMRSLYFVLATAINKFYYLRFSLVFLLGFVGVKILLQHYYPIPALVSLCIIVFILAMGIIASVVVRDGKLAAYAWPIYSQFKEIAIITASDIKRVMFILAGLTCLLIGFAMLVLPGPGLLFIAIGLILLAREFIWARKLLKKIKKSNQLFQTILDSVEPSEKKDAQKDKSPDQ